MLAMRHPNLFACVGDHSGDGLFDDLFKDMLWRVCGEVQGSVRE